MRDWVRRATGLRMFCALALFLLGFAGHAAAMPDLEPYGSEYRLPDGTYASLCMPSHEGGTTQHGSRHCDTCVTSTVQLLAPPEAAFAAVPELRQGMVMPQADTANPRRILSHHGQSRGPPLNA